MAGCKGNWTMGAYREQAIFNIRKKVGKAKVICGSDTYELLENQSTYVPQGVKHRLLNPGTEILEIVEVQSGEVIDEDDIERFEDSYGRI